jgi:hypothetical protein
MTMTSYSEKLSENLKRVMAQSSPVPVGVEKMVVEENTSGSSKPSSNPFEEMSNSIRTLKILIGKARLGSTTDADRALKELDILKGYVDRARDL